MPDFYRVVPVDDQGDRFEWAIVDPLGRIKHRSWSRSNLAKLAAELNEAYRLGMEANDRK